MLANYADGNLQTKQVLPTCVVCVSLIKFLARGCHDCLRIGNFHYSNFVSEVLTDSESVSSGNPQRPCENHTVTPPLVSHLQLDLLAFSRSRFTQ